VSREADLAAYYDQEAERRASRQIDPERLARRDRFAALLAAEGRSRVLEVGTGPGVDAAALQAGGVSVSGVDLSAEHVARCRAAGVDAHVASVLALPFADHTFDAAWSMSTLLHVPDDAFDRALHELRRVLVSGSLLAVGVWTGDDTEGPVEQDEFSPPRFFSFRSPERLRTMLGRHGVVEVSETWPSARSPALLYQWCLLRVAEL